MVTPFRARKKPGGVPHRRRRLPCPPLLATGEVEWFANLVLNLFEPDPVLQAALFFYGSEKADIAYLCKLLH
jgi:hypothetical protein